MALKCAICGRDKNSDGKAIDTVCHHCGRPLCDNPKCRFIIANDPVFFQRPALWERVKHWFTDWFEPHPLSLRERIEDWFRSWFEKKLVTGVISYHCREHKEQFHKYQRAVKPDQIAKPPVVAADSTKTPPPQPPPPTKP